jgi:hypothetical protein
MRTLDLKSNFINDLQDPHPGLTCLFSGSCLKTAKKRVCSCTGNAGTRSMDSVASLQRSRAANFVTTTPMVSPGVPSHKHNGDIVDPPRSWVPHPFDFLCRMGGKATKHGQKSSESGAPGGCPKSLPLGELGGMLQAYFLAFDKDSWAHRRGNEVCELAVVREFVDDEVGSLPGFE